MKPTKLFKRMLAVVLLALLLPQWATAYDFKVDGLCYNYNSDDTSVTVTYQRTVSPYYSNLSGDLVIPETVTYNGTTYSVTSIDYNAFYDCSGLASVTIPNSVTFIGGWAFCGCSGLAFITVESGNTVYDSRDNCNAIIETASNTLVFGCKTTTIPNSVTSIGKGAFSGCSGLTSVTIPNSVTSIGERAFYYCSGLTSVSIPNSVTSIGVYAFYGCSGLTSVTIPNSVTSIGEWAFSGCSGLTSVTIGNSVTSIGSNAFYGTAWYNNQPDGLVYAGLVAYEYKGTMPDGTSIVINNGTKGIAGSCFQYCSGLTSVTIPNSVTSIGERAFQECSRLTGELTIPNSVTYIGNFAFAGCRGLTSVTIPNSVTSIGGSAFYYSDKSLNRTLTLCGGVETIGSNAFGSYSSSYRNVATLILKDEVVNIKNLGVYPTQIYTYATTPPECDNNSFTGYSATLHVPASAMAAYYTAPYWQNFANIVGDAIQPTSLTLSADTAYVKLGSQLNLQATLQPSNTGLSIAWSTSDASIATVNNNGVVNALQPGECDIIVTCAGLEARCHVVVLEQQITITLDHHELEMDPNTLQWLTPSFDPISTDITASCSNSDVVLTKVINNRVQVLAVQPGRAVVTVRSADGKAVPDSCVVIVRGVQAESITLDQTQAEVTEGNVLQLTATILPEGATNKGVTWTSSNEQVAIVNESGAVAALSPGTATITATTQDGSNLSATCQVTVRRKIYLASSVTLDQTAAEVTVGETLQLTATVLPEDATDRTVTWTSSNTAVATVNANGLVTAVTPGTATITATTNDGTELSASCDVTVGLRGDVNLDGEVDVADVNILVNIILRKEQASSYNRRAYINDDDAVDVSDVNVVVNIILHKE